MAERSERAGGKVPSTGVKVWRTGVPAVALLLAVGHIAFPDLKIDAVVIGLVIFASLPWLGAIIESLEFSGVKVNLRKLQEELDETKGELNETKGEVSSVALKAEAAFAGVGREAREGLPAEEVKDPEVELRELARRYEEIRKKPSGHARTAEMTRVLRDMLALAPRLPRFEWRPALESDEPGTRLAGYAVLYACPRPEATDVLVHTLTRREAQPFGQYWAIQALGRVLGEGGDLGPGMREELEQFRARLRPEWDRYYELTRLLRDLGSAEM
jgi:hypothetical protein